MNYIDEILKNKDAMTADDIIQAIAERMYKEPNTWKNISKYPQFIQDILYIIDYDTELQMEGLSGFLRVKKITLSKHIRH